MLEFAAPTPISGGSADLVRRRFTGLDRSLFDLLCLAGYIDQAVPGDASLSLVAGRRDPRRRLKRLVGRENPTATHAQWLRAGRRLLPALAAVLEAQPTADRRRHPLHPLSVMLGNATIALAPDCVAPADPALAWTTSLELYEQVYPARVEPLGPLTWLDSKRLSRLGREIRAGMRQGRSASGSGRPGRAARELAVDPQLMRQVGKALRKTIEPGYEARYVFYSRPGDHFWPHPDDPEYEVNILYCVARTPPTDGSTASAFLAFRSSGTVERHAIGAGCALAFEAQGTVHGREPLKPGERVALLSIAARFSRPSRSRKSPRRAAATRIESNALALQLFEEAHVVTIPGSSLGRSGEGCLRLCYGSVNGDAIGEAIACQKPRSGWGPPSSVMIASTRS